MGVISKGGIRGEKKRPGRACQHCDVCITTICRKTGVPENLLPDNPRT